MYEIGSRYFTLFPLKYRKEGQLDSCSHIHRMVAKKRKKEKAGKIV